MGLDKSLKRIENDITSGDYGKARDRLNSLIYAYPDNLGLREKLGEVYWKLQYPAMAGRFWYLVENKSPDMIKACEAFEKECGHNPWIIAKSLKFRGDVNKIENQYALKTIKRLYRGRKELVYSDKKGSYAVPANRLSDSVHTIGCLTIMLIAFVLMIIGLITVLQY